jgi:hypothetical protein
MLVVERVDGTDATVKCRWWATRFSHSGEIRPVVGWSVLTP